MSQCKIRVLVLQADIINLVHSRFAVSYFSVLMTKHIFIYPPFQAYWGTETERSSH